MKIDISKTITALVIAILYFFFIQSLISAVYPEPKYDSYCIGKPYPARIGTEKECSAINVNQNDSDACYQNDGFIEYTYNETGCPVAYECQYCQRDYEAVRKKFNGVTFTFSSIFGIISVVAGLIYSNKKKNWILNGFMLGGFLLIFIGTIRYFDDMNTLLRPFVMFAELLIVVYTAYRKIA